MTYLSNIQRNIILLVLIIPFLIVVYLDYFEPWVYILYLFIYFLFVVEPVLKNIYYENGTWIQRIILAFLFVFLSWGVFSSYNFIDVTFLFFVLFLIVLLNYTSITLQISPNYHPIISNLNTISIILNIVIIILSITSLFINIIIWGFEYYIVLLVNILLIVLFSSLMFYTINYKKRI